MVFGGHHHVFLAGLPGQPRPGTRGVGLRRKAVGEELVFRNGDAFLLHGPFMAAQDAVQSPVNEHAEPGVMPPLHAPLTVRVAARRGCEGRTGAH